MKKRDQSLDTMRGLSVLMMFIFHFIYDLNYFELTHIPLLTDRFYIAWRYLIVSLFLLSVGISLALVYGHFFHLVKFLKRLLTLAIAALTISVATYIVFPHQWIYLGILHMIWLACLVSIVLVKRPKTALCIAVVIFILGVFNQPDLSYFGYLLNPYLPSTTLDFYPLFPWLGVVLIGIYLGHFPIYRKLIVNIVPLQFLGRHALFFYLTHQLVLFPIAAIISYLVTSD